MFAELRKLTILNGKTHYKTMAMLNSKLLVITKQLIENGKVKVSWYHRNLYRYGTELPIDHYYKGPMARVFIGSPRNSPRASSKVLNLGNSHLEVCNWDDSVDFFFYGFNTWSSRAPRKNSYLNSEVPSDFHGATLEYAEHVSSKIAIQNMHSMYQHWSQILIWNRWQTTVV